MFTQDLADIYDGQAQKFSSTRQKHRPEMDYIAQAIGEGIRRNKKEQEGSLSSSSHNLLNPSSAFTILEVGCGDGRLLDTIKDKIEDGDFSYTGIDISEGLLTIARKNHPKSSFITSGMISHLESMEEGSIDILVGIASVQHLFPQTERERFFDLAQKALRPGGMLILTNRARSDWAKEKYSRPRQCHLGQRVRTSGKRTSGDQMIPRTDPDTREVHQRYYHFFSLSEIQSHLASGRDIHTLAYIDRDGMLTQSVCQARNSLLIVEKNE